MIGRKNFAQAYIVGEKVRLRPIETEDAPIAYGLLQNERVTQTILWDGPSSLNELAFSFHHRRLWWSNGEPTYTFAIEAIAGGGIIGSVEIRRELYPQQLKIGYWLGVPHWGEGFGTDAVRLATNFAFQHLEAIRVSATVFIGNEASKRVLEKNGFQLGGVSRSQIFKRGHWLDEWLYTLLWDEWQSCQHYYEPQSERVRELL